ncbi:hypothetical protein JYU34_011313, partial [Plutella xylostella]
SVYTYEDEYCANMPIITLEVLSGTANYDVIPKTEIEDPEDPAPNEETVGLHFLTEGESEDAVKLEPDTNDQSHEKAKETKPKQELLEYVMRTDGSVLCKLCGEILKNRTHWYRHKYKFHVMPLNPTPLFQCEYCLVYFKSRKGYVGHLSSRHSELLSDSSPVLSNSQLVEALKEKGDIKTEVKLEIDPEISIPKTTLTNLNSTNVKTTTRSSGDIKKPCRLNRVENPIDPVEQEEQRIREEKLVADIISRVKKECEARGSGSATRKGYTRRTTVMHT